MLSFIGMVTNACLRGRIGPSRNIYSILIVWRNYWCRGVAVLSPKVGKHVQHSDNSCKPPPPPRKLPMLVWSAEWDQTATPVASIIQWIGVADAGGSPFDDSKGSEGPPWWRSIYPWIRPAFWAQNLHRIWYSFYRGLNRVTKLIVLKQIRQSTMTSTSWADMWYNVCCQVANCIQVTMGTLLTPKMTSDDDCLK